jgi:hypothetical protein
MDGKVWHVPDSRAWEHIDATFPDFANEPRNVRLGLATDGMNPFGEKSNTWSTWPVPVLNYNLPPWLVMKKFFLLLYLIIPGPDSVKSSNFDVYLAAVLEELATLWKGVRGVDVLQPPGRRQFIMRAILMWTIHDFPGYGIVSGCQHQGYKACPPCGSNIVSRWCKELGNLYLKEVRDGCKEITLTEHILMQNILMAKRSCEGGLGQQQPLKH